jgi:uncharacterized membrane protein
MPTSIFLAKLIGPIAIAIGIGVLINRDTYRKLAEEFLASLALIFLSGILTMTAGVAIVLNHNVWALEWRVIITLVGWLATLGGLMRILFPQRVEHVGRWVLARPAALCVAAAVWIAIGVALCIFGYFRHP